MSLSGMLSEKVISERSFTWMRVLRYHMDVRNVLRAKQEPIDPVPPLVQSDYQPSRQTSRTTTRRASYYTTSKTRKESVGE